MTKKREKLRSFRVYYFTGDYWSTKGEKRRCNIIMAHSESEAEYIFKRNHPDRNFGWVEETKKGELNG